MRFRNSKAKQGAGMAKPSVDFADAAQMSKARKSL
jgi:hypothetical protein